MSKYAKLKWHCRRGMRELDLLLERFLESRYDALTDSDKERFSRLLEEPNGRLVDWILEGGEPDVEYREFVSRIRAYR
ncbi:MAG: antitoxin CptB [Candidatus Kentron sp. G]|nr:MAG: antitoxin CptB [Candidatus Kentron sp. G]VFM97769.1 MAG: antitoxin CptB [Candidatus Kentron sp. G]VFN00234.1 MAG: antitoxin CptB [Candidatus Kentron sp. G]